MKHVLPVQKTGFFLCTFALIRVGKGFSTPLIALRAGKTNKWQVTAADTGFPGNANTNLFPFMVGIVKYFVGFLQFIPSKIRIKVRIFLENMKDNRWCSLGVYTGKGDVGDFSKFKFLKNYIALKFLSFLNYLLPNYIRIVLKVLHNTF